MRTFLLVTLLGAGCLLPLAAMAQQSALQAATPEPPVTMDPVLTAPVASLTPEQIGAMQKKLADWAQLGRYREENATLPPAPAGRVVFYGDSITDAWGRRDNSVFFPGKPYVNRGISGQTTPQMLVRFQQDVVALKPAAVLVLGGTNDIAGNTGLETLPVIEDNFRSMVAIAKANRIRVILASVLPVSAYRSRPGMAPAQTVRDLNTWLKQYAAEQGCTYLDYYSALVDDQGGMKAGASKDGLHPNPYGYTIMAPLAQAAIDTALRR